MDSETKNTEWSFLCDMDGVLLRGNELIPGAADFIGELRDYQANFMVLTNNSIYTPNDLRARLSQMGLALPVENIWTSALATARFLQTQHPQGSAYVIGEAGLTTALHDVGYTLTDTAPDYVILGESRNYTFEAITRAIHLIQGGAKFIITNPDNTTPTPKGIAPATGAVAAMITETTGVLPYSLGKPNPLMTRYAIRNIGAHSQRTILIGDRMDTDILAGVESGLSTCLVLTGIYTRETMKNFSYQPTMVLDSIADLVGRVEDPLQMAHSK